MSAVPQVLQSEGFGLPFVKFGLPYTENMHESALSFLRRRVRALYPRNIPRVVCMACASYDWEGVVAVAGRHMLVPPAMFDAPPAAKNGYRHDGSQRVTSPVSPVLCPPPMLL